MFMMSFFEVPSGVLQRIDFRSRFFGKEKSIRRNIDLLDGTSYANLRNKGVRNSKY